MSRRQRSHLTRTMLFLSFLAFSIPLVVSYQPAIAESDDALQDLGESDAEDKLDELFAEKPDSTSAPLEQPTTATSEADLNGEIDELTRDMSKEVPARRAEASEREADPSIPNHISNLEFKHDSNGSRVVISSHHKLRFTETKSPGTRQFVYLFENTQTPEKFQRAYDTTEFASPVALFTLFQLPNSTTPTSKLIVQLREDKVPSITDSDRGLILEFPPAKAGEPQIVDPTKRDILSGDNIYAKGGVYTGEVIQRLEIKNSDIQDVLRLIARTSGYNVVIGEEVSGKVGTLSLTNIPWDQAFTLVLQSKRLGFVREGNVLRIGTTIALRQEKDEAAQVEKAQERVEPLKTILLPISYAKAAELSPRAKPFMTERGTVDVDTRTNTIIVRDVEKVVTRVQRLLQSLDTQPPRVSIAAKIVEMRSSVTRNMGLGRLVAQGNLSGVNVGADWTMEAGGSFAATINAPNFLALQTRFQLGELDNRVKLLATPSVSVVANQTGRITQSLTFYVPTSIVVGGAVQVSQTPVNTTLNMTVTPIVSGDGAIFMNVDVSNDIPTISGVNSQVATRSVKTQVLVENGDTAVLGGVFQSSMNNDKEGLPLLMRIPLLGYLFSRNTTIDNRSEIFIFLTAKIMNAEESFKRTL